MIEAGENGLADLAFGFSFPLSFLSCSLFRRVLYGVLRRSQAVEEGLWDGGWVTTKKLGFRPRAFAMWL